MDFVFVHFSVDPFTKKEWYDVKAPSMFEKRNIGKTMVTRTQGTSTFVDACVGSVVNPGPWTGGLFVRVLYRDRI